MRITNELSDHAVLKEIGSRVARYRINGNLAQAELAHEAGVSRKTVTRVESGHPVQTPSLVRILRVLGLLANCEVLVPDASVSPIESYRSRGRQRQRASGSTAKPMKSTPWKWGDEE